MSSSKSSFRIDARSKHACKSTRIAENADDLRKIRDFLPHLLQSRLVRICLLWPLADQTARVRQVGFPSDLRSTLVAGEPSL